MLRSESAATSVSMVSFSSSSHGSTANQRGHSYKSKYKQVRLGQLCQIPGRIKNGYFIMKGSNHMALHILVKHNKYLFTCINCIFPNAFVVNAFAVQHFLFRVVVCSLMEVS